MLVSTFTTVVDNLNDFFALFFQFCSREIAPSFILQVKVEALIS